MATTQNNDLAALQAQVQMLTTALAAGGKRMFKNPGPRDKAVGSKAVQEAHSEKLVTYRALENGIDHKQGFVPAGAIFSTTQPQGKWMEPVETEAKKAPAKSEDKA